MTMPLDPTKFAAARFAFLEGVSDDVELPKIAARLAVKLATKYMRAEAGGFAWPSIKSLCADLGVKADSAIRKALSAMVARGHLTSAPVPGATTRYSIAGKYFSPNATRVEAPLTPVSFEAGSNHTPPVFEADTPVSFEADTPPIFEATNTGQGNPDNEYRTKKSGHSPPSPSGGERRGPGRRNPPSGDEAAFEAFWNAYPRKVGKASARKAFGKSVAGGAGPAEIMLGAMRFAAEREAAEPDPARRIRFTPHAATWLNAGRWSDEPEALPPLEITSPPHWGQRQHGGASRPACGRFTQIALEGLSRD